MQKNILSTLLLTTLIFTFYGCGDAGASGQQIGYHDKNLQQHDFNASIISWEVDNQEGLKIHLDDTYLYLQFTHNNAAKNIQFFLDIDNNPKTGNLTEDGADYVVENGYLYKAMDPKVWDWKELGAVKSSLQVGVSDTIAIELSKLEGKTPIFRANAQALGDNWIPVLYSPSGYQKTTYTP
jgi:hypothetical protein